MNDWQGLTTGIKTKKIGEHEGAGIYLLRFDPGAACGPEAHPQRETGVVLEGAVKLRLGFVDELVDGDDLTGFDVPPGEEHTITAGAEGALMLVVARPDW
jgi:quercetin dioxygenase-like cupin family protein